MPFSHASFSIIWLWAAERLKLEFEHWLWNTGQTTLLGSLLRGWFPQIKWQGAKSEDGSGGIWWLGEWGLNTPSQQGWLESLRRAVIKNSLGIRSPKGNQSGIWIKSSSPKMYQTQHKWISCYRRSTWTLDYKFLKIIKLFTHFYNKVIQYFYSSLIFWFHFEVDSFNKFINIQWISINSLNPMNINLNEWFKM